MDRVYELIKKFVSRGKILYSKDTKEVFILNWIKYNSLKSGKVMNCVEKELQSVKNKGYVKKFVGLCIHYGYPIDTLSIDYGEEEKEEEEVEIEEEKEIEEENNIHVATDVARCDKKPVPAEKPEKGGAQSTETGKDGYTKEFQRFWEHYPRKIEKKKAFRVWKTRLKEKVKPEDLISASEHYATFCKKQNTDKRFIKHGSTFLGPDKPYEEYINGPPEQVDECNGPQSWDTLQKLYQEYSEKERGAS